MITRPLKHQPGERYGKLVLLEYIYGGIWLCQCDCGKLTEAYINYMVKGKKKSCGCLPKGNKKTWKTESPYTQFMKPYQPKPPVVKKEPAMPPPPKFKPGDVFGHLKIIERNGGGWCRCLCKCGNVVNVLSGNLRRGNTVSCGCFGLSGVSGAAGPAVKKQKKKNKEANTSMELENLFFKRS